MTLEIPILKYYLKTLSVLKPFFPLSNWEEEEKNILKKSKSKENKYFSLFYAFDLFIFLQARSPGITQVSFSKVVLINKFYFD